MFDEDFQDIKLVSLNIFRFRHIPYMFNMYHLSNFLIRNIFRVLEVENLIGMGCENHWFLDE